MINILPELYFKDNIIKLVCELSGYKGEIDLKKGREVDPSRFVYSIEKARMMLGFEPKYSFREGLKAMFEERGK